jgi:hypothetical protein
LFSRTWRTRTCERCASEHRTKPNHFPLPFLRHGSDLLMWRFTTFDLDQLFRARSAAPPAESSRNSFRQPGCSHRFQQ